MEFLHQKLDLGASDVMEVLLDHAANVQLLDPSNFDHYRNGRPYRYYGGYATESPYRIPAPHAGTWHLVIDLGGAAGTVRASVRVLSETSAA
jgi:hypothetical protein